MVNITNSTIAHLVACGSIPCEGAFEITETLLVEYCCAYSAVNNKSGNLTSKSNAKFARRLAGLNLLKENISRGVKATAIRAGHIYLISNPAFPEHYKLGVSYDVHKRLQTYQTYSPYRDFKLESYDFVLDKLKVEKRILTSGLVTRDGGEWILRNSAKTLFSGLASSNLETGYSW